MDYRARVAPSPSDLSLLQPLDAGSLLSQLGQLSVNLHSASGLKAKDMNGKSDPYVVFKFSIFDQVILKEVRSGVKEKTVTPLWEESIVISERMSEELVLSGKLSLIVMDKDFGSMRDMLNSTDDKLGECVVALNVLDGNQSHEFKQALSPEGTVHFTVRFRPRVEASGVGETAWMDLEAATRLQRKFRQRKARRRMRAELAERKRRLLFFSWPIFAASMFDLVANTVVEHLIYWAQIEEMWYLYSILFIVPSIVICVRDLRLENRPRFSIAHGMFFIIVLYRVALKAALIDIFVEYYLTLAFTDTSSGHFNMSNGHFNMSSDDFNSSSISSSSGLYPVPKGKGALVQTFVPLLTMIIHLSIFIMVTSFGKLSLELVATPNACAHLLFPFQFFDFVFLYSFFTLRSMDTPLTISWVLQQIVLQINIVLRNSGTTEVLVARCGLGNRIFNFLTGKKTKDKLKNFDPNQDPLIRLQYLARIGWQFDLADVCALLIVPTVVTVMIWRQGFYSLEGSTILVRPCELRNVWARFAVLLCIKPAASWIARVWLRAKMRSTLLGKNTMHGTSQIAAKIIAMRKLRVQGMQGGNMDEKVQSHFDFKEEEMAAMQEELSLSGLNYSVLRAKLMKKWRFFLTVVLFQIFSAFPCRSTVPGRIIERCDLNGTKVVAIVSEPLTVQSSWYYVPPEIAISTSPILIGAYAASVEESANTADCNITSSFFTTFRDRYAGWETLGFPDFDEILAADYVLSPAGGYVNGDYVLESYVPEEREKIELVLRIGNCTREARGGDF